PHMYHQSNMRAYDGTHTLLGDLLDMAFSKFRTYSTLPIISLRQEDIGSRMADTMGRNWSGATGTVVNGTQAKFTSPQEAWDQAVCTGRERGRGLATGVDSSSGDATPSARASAQRAPNSIT